VVERRSKTQLMAASHLSDNTTAVTADHASTMITTPLTQFPAVKDSPDVTPVQSMLDAIIRSHQTHA